MHAHPLKMGHITMDNASNNGAMMESLAQKLKPRDVPFDARDNRIMCFAHIIDLCSGRAICAASGVDEGVPPSNETASDPISVACAAVRAIWGSGKRQRDFERVIADGNKGGWFKAGRPPETVHLKPLQLLRDVPTRWDSVFHMLHRLREMRPVCRHTSLTEHNTC